MEKLRIVVVEDEGVVAIDIEESLKSLGYEVAGVFAEGEEAVPQVGKLHPDLVLMDIRLKGEMDGITAASLIGQQFQTPVIFLTAYADEATLSRAKLVEPYGYILKPFEEAELRAAIELAVHRARSKVAAQIKVAGSDIHADQHTYPPTEQPAAPSTTTQFLTRIPLFNKLPARIIQRFAEACRSSSAKAGDLIVYEGDETPSSFIVMEGRIAMIKTSLNGKELIVELLPPGDIFALLVALQKLPSPLSARAQIDSKILWVPTALFASLLEQSPELYRFLNELMAERLRTSHDLARGLAHDKVEVRIASTLCALVPKFGEKSRESASIFNIPMTRQEIADLTGTTPETAIRTTKMMEREGLLDLSRPAMVKILNLKGLQELAESGF